MNDWYFYQERGKTVGPFNLDDIKSRIQDGRIKVFDLIYKDGENMWRMALEHSVLRTEFKNFSASGLKDRPWVCLQKKAGDSTEFVTKGPFTREEIRASIQSGEISYSDYAWKDGFSEWKRIGLLEEFNSRVQRQITLPPVPPIPDQSGTDLLRNVVELKRLDFANFDFDMRPERDSDFLPPPPSGAVRSGTVTPAPVKSNYKATQTSYSISDEVTHVNVPAKPPPVSPPVKSKSKSATPSQTSASSSTKKARTKTKSQSALPFLSTFKPTPVETAADIRIREDDDAEEERPKPWFDWGLVGVLVLVLTGTVLIVSRVLVRHTPTPDSIPQVVAVEPPAPLPTAQPVHEEVPTLPPAEPEAGPEPAPPPREKPPKVLLPKAAESLFLKVQAVSGGQPRIIVRSDGVTDKYPVYLQIIGLTGQVNEGGAYYRYMRLVPNGNWMQPIDLPPLKLPQGKFIVRAETGELKKETKFSWGVNDTKGKLALAHQRKAWAYAIWKERLALFRLSLALEKQLQQALLPNKKFSGRGWDPLVALKRGSGGNYLMFDDWWELHNMAVKDAKSGVNGALVTRAQKERERLASFSIWK